MSTIATPREPSLSSRRVPLISTPTSSSRPSLDNPRSNDGSPSWPPIPPSTSTTVVAPKRNRAALREYYNLQPTKTSSSTTAAGPSSLSTSSQPPSSPASSSLHSLNNDDEGLWGEGGSEMDKEGFDAEEYVKKVLEEKSLAEVLGIYRGVLADVRALDAERKALVYDNYSKLIVATEMIGRMRNGVAGGTGGSTGVGKGGIGAGKGEGVEGVEELVEKIRKGVEGLRRDGENEDRVEREKVEKRRRARAVVQRVLDAPERVRGLVKEGKVEEARKVWEKERKLLERWRERGVGGDDVGICIEDGDKALRGEKSSGREDESKP